MGGKGSGGAHNPKGNPRQAQVVKDANDPAKVDPKVNSKVMKMGIWLMGLESPDYASERALKGRFAEYLEMCDELGIRPMVTSAAQAFGLDRSTYYRLATNYRGYENWHDGALTPESRLVLTKSYEFLNAAWETYLVDEKGNPVKWIFLGKNYFGMRDQTEHVQVRADITPQLTSPEDVAAKYAKMVGKPQEHLPESTLESVEDV